MSTRAFRGDRIVATSERLSLIGNIEEEGLVQTFEQHRFVLKLLMGAETDGRIHLPRVTDREGNPTEATAAQDRLVSWACRHLLLQAEACDIYRLNPTDFPDLPPCKTNPASLDWEQEESHNVSLDRSRKPEGGSGEAEPLRPADGADPAGTHGGRPAPGDPDAGFGDVDWGIGLELAP